MSADEELIGTSTRFSEVLEAKIEAREGLFEEPHPFLRTALRGLAKRLNPEIVPMGFLMTTELYIYDINSGKDGFTGEPMPRDVVGMPLGMNGIIRLVASEIASEAFGEDFGDAVVKVQQKTAASSDGLAQ
jgi:hypothetical protein